MELKCEHNRNPSVTRPAASEDSLAPHVIKFVQITGF